jgi:hypothetical protein
MRDQPAALIWRNPMFVDRARDGCVFVRSFDDADEFRGRSHDVEDAPGMGALLLRLDWS